MSATYRPEIDGLRALAVVPVVLYHSGFSAFSGGFVGVDIFFVISGYLITNILLRDIGEKRFSILSFYERRIRRILPALLTVCLTTIPFAFMWMFPGDLKNFASSLLGVILFISNFHFWSQTGYFSTSAELEPLIHTWTIAVEEQFYIFFPLLLWCLKGLSRAWLASLIGALTVGSFVLSEILSEYAPAANYYLLPSRAWELGAGALVAILQTNGRMPNALVGSALSLLGLALIVWALVIIDRDYPYPGRWTLLPVVGSILVVAYADKTNVVGKLLALRPLVGIGLISYSAYLWHQPIFAFARLRVPTPLSALDYALLILATFALAWITWRLIETPFRNRKSVPFPQVGVMLAPMAIACAAFAVVASTGLPDRAEGKIASISRELSNWPGIGPCKTRDGLELCGNFDQPTVILWGDSYAEHLEAGATLGEASDGLVKAVKYACGPILDLSYVRSRSYTQQWAEDCTRHNAKVAQYVESTRSLRYAILSFNLANYTENPLLFRGDVRQSQTEFLVERIASTLDWLRSHNIQPILIGPPPHNGFDLGRCVAKSRLFETAVSSCDFEQPHHEYEESVFRGLAELGYEVVRIETATCDQGQCRTTIGETGIYRDGGHLTWEGSRLVGERLKLSKPHNTD